MIESSMKHFVYIGHTKSSFYYDKISDCLFDLDSGQETSKKDKVLELIKQGESSLLPYRISITMGDAMRPINRSGRGADPRDARLTGKFTKNEESPYKKNNPYEVQTGLWKVDGYQSYFYGSIGISGANGKIKGDTGDLIIIRTNNWRKLDLYIFRGLAGANGCLGHLSEVMDYLTRL